MTLGALTSREMLGLYGVTAMVVWINYFNTQFRSPMEAKRSPVMRNANYVFYSNHLYRFPKWFVFVLFLNWRQTRLPVLLVVAQMANSALAVFYYAWYLCVGRPLGVFMILVQIGVMGAFEIAFGVDMDIYNRRHPKI